MLGQVGVPLGRGTVVDDAGTWIRRGVEEARKLGDAVSKVTASGRGGYVGDVPCTWTKFQKRLV